MKFTVTFDSGNTYVVIKARTRYEVYRKGTLIGYLTNAEAEILRNDFYPSEELFRL